MEEKMKYSDLLEELKNSTPLFEKLTKDLTTHGNLLTKSNIRKEIKDEHKYYRKRGKNMDLKEITKVTTSDLVVELLHRKEVDVVFLENNDEAFIDMSNVHSYTNKTNRHIKDASIILIYKHN